jgi:hypothetical protein
VRAIAVVTPVSSQTAVKNYKAKPIPNRLVFLTLIRGLAQPDREHSGINRYALGLRGIPIALELYSMVLSKLCSGYSSPLITSQTVLRDTSSGKARNSFSFFSRLWYIRRVENRLDFQNFAGFLGCFVLAPDLLNIRQAWN